MNQRAQYGMQQSFEMIRHAPFLSGYHLTAFVRSCSTNSGGSVHSWQKSFTIQEPVLLQLLGESSLAALLDQAVRSASPKVIRIPAGLFYFAVPVDNVPTPSCLVGYGVRDADLDLVRVEHHARRAGIDSMAFLKEIDRLPIVSFGTVAGTAGRVMSLVRHLQQTDAAGYPADSSPERLRLVVELSEEFDRAETAAEIMELLCESVGLMFDLPGIVRVKAVSAAFRLEAAWGLEFDPVELCADACSGIFAGRGSARLSAKEVAALLPAAAGNSGTVITLAACGRQFGYIILLGEHSTGNAMMLQELLAGRASLRLALLQSQAERALKEARAERLLAIFNELIHVDGTRELCRLLLARSGKLVGATSGSVMLLDDRGELLSIVAVQGMNPVLAQSITVRYGHGIAGQVVKSGQPVLVHDIGSERRFIVGQRPRFKTGSFVSLPLSCGGETFGVLNLADRSDHEAFSEADLDQLTKLGGLAAVLIRRSRYQESTRHLEKLSITDPLTELYNRRFLERRLEEEIARSSRNGLKMSLMMLDLDCFKLYNDLCGHQAGDRALQMVANVLCASVREMDVVTRYGGEEFCILLPDTPKVDAMYVAERIRYGVEHELFSGEEELPMGRMTVSIGIASFPDNGTTSGELILSADVALYKAKAEGRNRVVGSADLPQEGRFRTLARPTSVHMH